jgi:hypothetical protein
MTFTSTRLQPEAKPSPSAAAASNARLGLRDGGIAQSNDRVGPSNVRIG